MRRLKRSRVRSFTICPRSVTKNHEGVPVITYGEGETFFGEVWPATSKRQIEMYGDRIDNISNMRLEGKYTVETEKGKPFILFTDGRALRLGDGVQVYDLDAPDYKILSFTQYYPLKLEVERIGY